MNYTDIIEIIITAARVAAKYTLRFTLRHRALIGCVLGAALLLYVLLLASTIRLRGNAVEYIRGSLGGDVQVGAVRVTPGLRIELRDVKVTRRDSELGLPDLTIERALVAADIPSLLRGGASMSDVVLENPAITVYQEPDGSYNLTDWFSRAEDCAISSVARHIPGRVQVHGGRLLLEPPPGASWFETLEPARFDGVFGRTTDNRVGVKLKVTAFKSVVDVTGSMEPCSASGFELTAAGDNFNFSGLADFIDMVLLEPTSGVTLPGGSGRLRAEIGGNSGNLYFGGSASMRDFDVSFSFASRVLKITELRAGMATERLSGSGTVDFNEPGAPFEFSLVMENFKLQRLFRGISGFAYSPEGVMSGYARLAGRLDESKIEVRGGSITVTKGALKAPEPELTGGFGRKRPVSIPFERLTASLSTRDGRLQLYNIRIESDTFTAEGTATLGGHSGFDLFEPGVSYTLNIRVTAPTAAAPAALFPSLRGRVDGELDATISIRGSFNRAGDIGGGGEITLRNGFVSNPYVGRGGIPYVTLDFSLAEAKFDLTPRSARISDAGLTGNGLSIELSGEIGYEGELRLDGEARMSPEWASDFVGVAPFVLTTDIGSLTTFSADFSIRGTLQEPEHIWERPSAIRWR